ncbi:hypothetical protein B5F77_01115 [Parabacteroides sp. An277]|uniref:DUF4493 domain-containing protein n=1 Tax=Parabacteroides sp. An277 TaxID=1965619 RepID=UPI000B3A115D|nr:DUF4493 domain-containing protein [Parabacteroides sp. An277]OUO55485.1 hypothetical protein B5F77_01115 [Parabacteroides sp. An277]
MKKIQTFIYVLLMGFAFAACQDDSLRGTEQGGIRIALTDGTAGVDVTTRSTPSELFDGFKQKFKFQIKGDNYDQTHEWTEDVIPLAAGVYDITATCGTEQAVGEVGFDAPYYKNKNDKSVNVTAGKESNITIDCTVGNALVSIAFADEEAEAEFEKLCPDAYIDIKLSGGIQIQWNNLAQSAYFRAGSSLETLTIYRSKAGDETTDGVNLLETAGDKVPSTFSAGDQLIFTLSLAKKNGTVELNVSKAELKTIPISETIPLEWLPAPKIGYFNDEEGLTSIEYTESNNATPAKLNFSGSMAIEDIELGFEFGDIQYADWNNKTYNLASISDEDKSALTQAGIVLPELEESTTGSIDFTNLTTNLQVASGSVTENKIKVRVKANNRWSSEEDNPSVYTIKTVAPKIMVTANEEDIWAKSLTVSEYEVESDNPTKIVVTGYQYLDGAEWKDCTNGLAELTNLPDEPKMQVRAVYREGVYAEPTEIALETPAQLPNSDMEEWSYETYKGDRYSFNPWNSEGTSFWDTNNDFTTRHKNGASDVSIANYNGFHAVSCVTGHNGFAAELRSTANGRANTRVDFIVHTHKEQDYNKVAGKLFTGSANVYVNKPSGTIGDDADGSKDTYTEEKNASFNSRPTALTFYYKYVPYNSDTWSVHIELLDENKNVIIQNDKTSSEAKSDWTQASVSLDYADETTYAKCKYIYVIFKSTINEGTNMPYREITQTFYVLENGALSAKTYDQAYIGSILTIDDIQLIYDK